MHAGECISVKLHRHRERKPGAGAGKDLRDGSFVPFE